MQISKVLPFISNATVLPMEKEIDITNDSGVTQDTLPSESTILDEGKTTTSSLPYILPTTETETAEPITIELTSAPIPSDVRKELRDSFVRKIVFQCLLSCECGNDFIS